MFNRILDIAEFLIERPPLAGALVWGTLYLWKKRRSRRIAPLSTRERDHTLEIYKADRPYSERMYDPPEEDETPPKARFK